MADMVLDENGNEIDKDGNQKKGLQADYMTKADVMAIISEYSRNFTELVAALDKAENGSGFSEAYDGMSKLAAAVSGGTHVDFARKNSWITDPAQRNSYLTTGGGVGIADKQLIIDFYKLVAGTSDFRNNFVQMLNSCIASSVYNAYSAVRFEGQMKDIVKAEEIRAVDSSFAEFAMLYDACNDASIYNGLALSKSQHSPEENLEMALDYLDDAICKKPHLGTFMAGAKKASPTVINQLYVYDRETRQFDSFASKEGSLQRIIDTCSELDAQLANGYAMAGDELSTYLDGYRKVLEKIVVFYQKAIDVIEAFKNNADTAPYCIMHYGRHVKDVTNMYSLGTIGNPLTDGTNYRELAQSMVSRMQNLAKAIAKNAPA